MKALLRSFAGGEITPEMYGRLDTTKYQTGLAECRNFTVLPHGPATRRPGLRYIAEVRDSTQAVRLIPFAFSADQTAVLEFSDQRVRFHIGGQQLLEANVAISSIVGSLVTTTGAHGYSTGDDVFIGTRYHRITVTGGTTFTTADRWGNATTASGANAARVYTVTTPYLAADLFDLHYAQDSDVLTIVSTRYAARELRRLGATNWQLTTITFAPPVAPVPALVLTPTVPATGNNEDFSYVYTYIAANGAESLPSAATLVNTEPLSLQGNWIDVSWAATAGAQRYNIYRLRGGIYGYIGSTTGLTIRDNNILPDTSKAPPESIYTLNGSSTEYPAAVTYYEQRRWFAGTSAKPQNVWATRNGTESNLSSSTPTQDDDGMEFRLKAQQQNAIRHLVPLSDVIALTVGGEFRIFADNAPNITPTSLSTKPQGYSGASNVQPALTSGSILYVQAQGSRVREMAYNWQSNAFNSIDLSIMSPHLFTGYTIVDLAYCRAPVPTLWAVRSDGVLLGLTYVPEQQVYGWHRHETDGFFESVCVVSEGLEDVLYALVRRTIGGRSVRYVERLQTRSFTAQEDAFFVDSGLSYDGSATDTLSGLYHLEGEAVNILADGAVHPPRTVVDGAITLDDEYEVVHVGLPYTSRLKTLPAVLEAQAAGVGTTRNVSTVTVNVHQSSTVRAGPDLDSLVEYPEREVTDNYGAPPALKTKPLQFDIAPDWNLEGSIYIEQTNPLPLTVLSIGLDVADS